MAGAEKTTRNLPVKTYANTSDRIVFISNAAQTVSNTASIAVSDLFANTANLQANLSQLRIVSPLGTPANSISTNVISGVMWSDGSFIYVASSNNHVKRVAISDF